MRALVIEDEEDVRRLLALMMSRLGFETVEAANGEEGLKQLSDPLGLDVVLLDWRMPVLDGAGFLKKKQANSALAKVPVMMLTGLNEMSDVVTALELGVKEYLMKPVTQRTLREKLALMGLA